ncbi:hypothetical protein CAL7716_091100 [Calothrix sp. PCC 7716]|nr:hypothetical protein CAL7716_091100 [Calothrix sp. PCC 7716]
MERVIKSGVGWRIGWNASAPKFKGLVGTSDWSVELTQAELDDFCRLSAQLADTMKQLAPELMDSEKIAIEAESDLIWMEAEGYHHSYSLRFIINNERACEGKWEVDAVPGLLQAASTLKVF